jgi:hypothetical protein
LGSQGQIYEAKEFGCKNTKKLQKPQASLGIDSKNVVITSTNRFF